MEREPAYLVFNSLQVEERVLMRVPPQNFSEEGAAGSDDDLVGLQLRILTGESHIKKIFLFPQVPESCAHVGFKVIPAEAEFLRGSHPGSSEFHLKLNFPKLYLKEQNH